MNIFEKYGIIVPKKEKEVEDFVYPMAIPTKEVIDDCYLPEKDPKGNPARLVECYGRRRIQGIWEYVHPMDKPDIVVKQGVTLEVKTGHGWLIEPSFKTQEALANYLDERRNPLIKASHIAYLPYRAVQGTDFDDCLFFTAGQLLTILGKREKLELKECRGYWGIAMKPWIACGYAQKSSAKGDAEIRAELNEVGLILEEFADKFNLSLFDYE